MSKFQVIKGIEVPATAARTRSRGEFATALAALEVGDGFVFEDKRDVKKLYPAVSPKKFGKEYKFKLWKAGEGQIGVKRIAVDANDATA